MKIKHKLLSDYQYLTPDKKIILIKSGVILEGYNYKVKTDIIPIDKEIVDNNPQLFEIIDWKAELLSYIKINKLPTPAVLTKKIIPFIEEMILSSISQQTGQKLDDSKIRELEQKETDLFSEEQSLNRKLVSLESKERLLKDKEDELREKGRELINKGLELDDKLQDINERERNLDLNSLKSAEEIDSKYSELQTKINNDLKSLSDREKELESKLKEISKRESDLESKEDEINDKIKSHEITLEDFENYKQEVLKLDREIKDWEGLHWKFQRNEIPPSAIPGTQKF
jgi:myosin heavy subunit